MPGQQVDDLDAGDERLVRGGLFDQRRWPLVDGTPQSLGQRWPAVDRIAAVDRLIEQGGNVALIENIGVERLVQGLGARRRGEQEQGRQDGKGAHGKPS